MRSFRQHCYDTWLAHTDEVRDWTGTVPAYTVADWVSRNRWYLKKTYKLLVDTVCYSSYTSNTLKPKEENTVSKMGNFVLDMQTDAVRMTREQFTDQYGDHNLWVWQQQHYAEPDEPVGVYPGSDPQV